MQEFGSQRTKNSAPSYIFDVTKWYSNTWGGGRQRASRHLFQDTGLPYDVIECDENDGLLLFDGGVLKMTMRGYVVLHGVANIVKTEINLTKVCHTPRLSNNLIFKSKLFEKGCIGYESDMMYMQLCDKPLFGLRTDHGVFLADFTFSQMWRFHRDTVTSPARTQKLSWIQSTKFA